MIAYLLLFCSALCSALRIPRDLVLENLALRHQLLVLSRFVPEEPLEGLLEKLGFLEILAPVGHVVGEVEAAPDYPALAVFSTGQEHLILLCQDRRCPAP